MIPHDEKLEGSFLGGLILNPNEFKYIQELFHEELFFDTRNQLIAKAIISLNNASKIADLISISNYLKTTVKNNPIDFYHLSVLTNDAVLSGFIEKLLNLSELYIKRKLIIKNTELIQKAQQPTYDVLELLGEQERITTEIMSRISVSNTATSTDCAIELDKHLSAISKLKEGDLVGLDTGFTSLNNLTSGWQNSDLIILAARPSMGKTSIALNFVHSALNLDKSVLVFSLEMSKMSLYARMCSQITDIPLNKFLKNPMSQEESTIYRNETFKLAQSKLFIEDKGGVDINFIKIKSRKLKRDKDIQLIVIDYIGLIAKEKSNKSTNDLVGDISGALKALAKELSVPIIVLSQLSREVEKSSDKRPTLSHLRDSGSIEQDADQVLFIYRPEYYGITDDGCGNSTIGKAEIIVAKNRNGALDNCVVNFDGKCTNFYEYKKEVTDYKSIAANDNFLTNQF